MPPLQIPIVEHPDTLAYDRWLTLRTTALYGRFILDSKVMNQHRRAQVGFWVWVIPTLACFGWMVRNQVVYSAMSPNPKYDWADSHWAAAYMPFWIIQIVGLWGQSVSPANPEILLLARIIMHCGHISRLTGTMLTSCSTFTGYCPASPPMSSAMPGMAVSSASSKLAVKLSRMVSTPTARWAWDPCKSLRRSSATSLPPGLSLI